jgi:hypothetical protein
VLVRLAGLFDALDTNGNPTWTIKDRYVARHSAEQDYPGLRDAAAAVVDDEVIGAPEPERSGREVELPLYRR